MSNAKLTPQLQALTSQKIKTDLDLHVHLKKAIPMDISYLKVLELTLDEWNSENDHEAFHDL